MSPDGDQMSPDGDQMSPDGDQMSPDAEGTPAKPRSSAGDGAIRVTQVRSAIGAKPKHRGTLRALGLRGVGKTNELPDRPEIRGMIARVGHLVDVEEAGT
jgi:large subunit ribosomal protein L30